MTANPGGGENSNAGGHYTVTAPSPGTEAAMQPSGTKTRDIPPSRNPPTPNRGREEFSLNSQVNSGPGMNSSFNLLLDSDNDNEGNEILHAQTGHRSEAMQILEAYVQLLGTEEKLKMKPLIDENT